MRGRHRSLDALYRAYADADCLCRLQDAHAVRQAFADPLLLVSRECRPTEPCALSSRPREAGLDPLDDDCARMQTNVYNAKLSRKSLSIRAFTDEERTTANGGEW